MISLRSRQSFISLALLHALLAAVTQTIPVVISQSTLNNEKPFQLSSHLVMPAGCRQTLLKRAVGAIPISSGFSDTTIRQEVARRAVGSVADSGKLCDPIGPLKSTPRLQARSHPVTGLPPVSIDIVRELTPAGVHPPAAESAHIYAKRSWRKPTSPPVKKIDAKKTEQPPNAGRPQAEYKYSRGATW